MKHTITGTVYYYKSTYSEDPIYLFSENGFGDSTDFVEVCKHSFEVEIPDDFNPVPQQVAALQEAKRQLRLKLGKELAELDERISKLTCLTHEVPA